MTDAPPPGYVAYRAVSIGLVIAAFVVFGVVVGLRMPGVWHWLMVNQQSLRATWLTWGWHLS